MDTRSAIHEIAVDLQEHLLYLQELGASEMADVLPERLAAVEQEPRQVPQRMRAETAPAPVVVEAERFVPPPDIAAITPPATSLPETPRPAAGRSRLNELPSLSARSTMPKRSPANSTSPPQNVQPPVVSAVVEQPDTEGSLFGAAAGLPESSETLEQIRADIGDCTRCPLYSGRTQIVHSTGNTTADLMFVGEAPGADEDAQGFPFVGRAGQLLTKIIESIGFAREDVFIGNINRCRPPGNRAPTLPEAHTCRPFLQREIAVVRPKVIVVLGNTAMHNLLDTKVGITKLRGEFQDYMGIKVMPTFHPAFLLRDPRKKREVWEDMKKVRDYLKENA
ncbi:MAG: uracil-DNA glycosylase family protein [Pyrinomonadaceae bacterium]